MYIPPHFAVTRTEDLHETIRRHPLGVLVTQADGRLDANHIPFELDLTSGGLGILTGHVARANPVWQECAGGVDVLIIFRGSEGYISPSWYPSKHETHRQVPTWNYEVVHAHGRMKVLDDERFVRGVVARLTRTHESNEATPWKMGDSAPDFIDSMLKAIVGVEVTVTHLEGKSKLSQNREMRDRQGAMDMLRQRDRSDLADAMAKTLAS